MSQSTNILDLPTDPVSKQGKENPISIQATETSQTQHPKENIVLDQTTISQIVSGLQQASQTGSTLLPSRDIPMETSPHLTDQQTHPNYIPQPPQHQPDYISNYEKSADIINEYNNNKQSADNLDSIYDEIQTPLLLAVIYFLLQLPFFRKILFTYAPSLFSADGNININGLVFTSIFFGATFYTLLKFTKIVNTF